MKQCARFREDGSSCINATDNADGWCRQADCPGFVRRDPSQSPAPEPAVAGTPKPHTEGAAAQAIEVTLNDIDDVHVTQRALDSFRFHHGGGQAEARVQLRNMLEDFVLNSVHTVTRSGLIRLSRHGYQLMLSPDRGRVVGYSTNHRERTWEQVKAGVKSRVRDLRAIRHASGTAPEVGPTVELASFHEVFNPATVHLTGHVRKSFARMAKLTEASDTDLDAALRTALAQLGLRDVLQRDTGIFDVADHERSWMVSADCRSLIGVKMTPPPQNPSVADADIDLSEHSI
ncbi:hypothetical protein [Mycolicibacterium septicum]|uniref:hypothetical protein n=1 Tax=Mycolicibacterium septicum TaxID=98668 RepID=UPI001AF4D9E6|nr:hypothetical protein [Mycolicibacterium septicum]QRY53816.1 hypothetical protein JVX95_11110 [Mycolicibacterium septicum]